MTIAGHRARAGDKLIIEHDTNLELQAQSCLEGLGISLLSEWDVLVFVHRRRVSLANSEQIARLLGYEDSVVERALDRLEREKLIERSRPSQGVRFYRILASMDAGRGAAFSNSSTLSETRAGRLLLTKQLSSILAGFETSRQSARSRNVKGVDHVWKAIWLRLALRDSIPSCWAGFREPM